jgi:tetraacyldisaccharide 4'-kinase
MMAPAFWWHRRTLAGMALAPFGAAYGHFVGRRMMAKRGATASVPVICVGNLIVGGAGKTPTALAVAAVCRKDELNPGFLTRGHGGREAGPIIVSPDFHTALDVGDEALLLAQTAPTVVSADRPSGAKLLASIGVDVVIMDDGFQNPSLNKDLSLVVVDARRGIGNGFVIPAGPLRAPLADQIRCADALIVIGDGLTGKSLRLAARAGRPILRAHSEPTRRRGLKRRPYLAFAGIAEPRKFYDALAATGARIGMTIDFPDHHLFTHADCERILAEARSRKLAPITTEKDRVRLNRRGDAADRLAAITEVFPIRIRFEEPRRLTALIADAIGAHASAYRRSAYSDRRSSDRSRLKEASASI